MKTPVCLVCGLRYSSIQARNTHGTRAHGSIPETMWRGFAEDHPRESFIRAVRGRKVQPTVPVRIEPQRRALPPKEDRHQAEGLDALPWVKYPRTEREANTVAAALGKLASTLPAGTREHAIILSHRDYFFALGMRIAKQKAAA